MSGIALIGCGWVARHRHLPAIERVEGLEVVALYDIDPDALARAGRMAPGASRHDTLPGLLADPRVQIVAVLSPAPFHAEHCRAAFAAAKQVMCEKPLALTLDDADAICAAGSSAGTLGATALMCRGLRVVQRARRAIAEGAIGQPVAVHTVYADAMADRPAGDRPWRRRRATGGGALQEKLVHHLDLWRHLTGLEVESVRSERADSQRQEDEAVLVTGRLSGGVLTSSMGLERTAAVNEIQVFGSEGRIALDLYRVDGYRLDGRAQVSGEPRVRLRHAAAAAAQLPAVAGQLRHGGEFTNTYVRQWEAFRDGVPLATLEDGRRATAALQMVG